MSQKTDFDVKRYRINKFISTLKEHFALFCLEKKLFLKITKNVIFYIEMGFS